MSRSRGLPACRASVRVRAPRASGVDGNGIRCYQHSSVFGHVQPDFWRAMLSWCFDAPNNTVLQGHAYQLVLAALKTNHEQSMQAFLGRLRRAAQLLRLRAQLAPLDAWSHPACRQLYPRGRPDGGMCWNHRHARNQRGLAGVSTNIAGGSCRSDGSHIDSS